MLIDYSRCARGDVIPKEVGGTAWLADGSGLAHALRFRTDPELASPRDSARDLPTSDGRRKASFNFDLGQRTDPLDGGWIVVEYEDEWGCVWETRRYVESRGGEAQSTTKVCAASQSCPQRGVQLDSATNSGCSECRSGK